RRGNLADTGWLLRLQRVSRRDLAARARGPRATPSRASQARASPRRTGGMKTALKLIAALVVAPLLLIGVAGSLALKRKAPARLTASQEKLSGDWKQFEPTVRADTARWKNDPLLAPRDGGDASALLFAHIRWERTGGEPPVPEALRVQMGEHDGGWPEHFE